MSARSIPLCVMMLVIAACSDPVEGDPTAGAAGSSTTSGQESGTNEPPGTSAAPPDGSTSTSSESSGDTANPSDVGGSADVPPNEPPPTSMGHALAVNPDSSPDALDAAFAHYEELGVDHIWATAALEWLCGEGPTCMLEPLDAVIERANERSWPVVLQVHGTPQWLDARGHWFGPDTDERRAAWVELFAQVVARYGTDVAYYEVWNEPNIDEFWEQGPNATAYAALLHDAYDAAKAIEPDAVIVGGNLSQNDLGFLARIYDAMDERYGADAAAANAYWFDVLGVHPYAGEEGQGFAPNDDSHPDVMTMFGAKDPDYLGYRRMHELAHAREGAPKDLAFGEVGYTTAAGWFSVAESDRAQYIVDALRMARDDGFVRYVAWYLHDSPYPDAFTIHGTSTEAGFTAAATEK